MRLGALSSPATTVSLPAAVLVVVLAGMSGSAPDSTAASGGPSARQAGRTHLVEKAALRLTSGEESTLYERGQAYGTFNAPLTASLNLSPGHVTAVFTIHPSGGSISGRASARFVVKGSTGYYGGTLKITRGTGRYRHVSGSNIAISGTINRQSFALTVKADGWISL